MRHILILVFAASGFAGLVYESVWSHYLRILVGSAAYAQSLVLAVFMGGMALGAWFASRRSGRWGNLLRTYALVELALGGLALVFHPAFLAAETLLFGQLFSTLTPPILAQAIRWTVAAGLILPQSILLGMTFPLMVGGFVRRYSGKPGAAVAVLYFANALGGSVGVLTSGFGLIRWVGLTGTLVAAAAVNLVVAGVMWRWWGAGTEPQPTVSSPQDHPSTESMGLAGTLLLVAGFAGFASLVYEIVWIRMLSLVLSSSSHAFELMLSAFILGIALGGLWIRGRIDALERPVRFLALVQVAMGLLAVATLPVYVRLFPLMQGLLEALPPTIDGYTRFNLASHAMALAVMLPATFCAGITLPVITHILLQKGHGERSIGRVYAVNTLGAVAGALVGVHWALPGLGLKATLVFAAGLNLALGAFLLWKGVGAADRRWGVPWLLAGTLGTAGIAALVGLDPAILASGVYRRHIDLADASQAEVLRHIDGKTASVSLVMSADGILSIRTNGKPSSSMAVSEDRNPTGDETVATLLGALPLVLKPDARTAVNVGMGSGITSHTLLASNALESVTTVEIEPAMVELARGFEPRNRRAFSDPRSRTVIQDARAFFSASRERFDIIVTQPFNPWVGGAGSLYSEEFYKTLASSLNPGGVLVQWVQLFETDTPLVASIIKALSAHFADYRVYAGATGDLLIAATTDGRVPPLDARALANPALVQDLREIDVRSIQDLAIRTAGNARTFGALWDIFQVPANSEFHPYVEQHAARARFMEVGAEEILRLFVQPIPIMELLGVTEPEWTETDITPAPAFFYSARPVAAVAFRNLVLLGQEPSRDGSAFERRARDEALSFQHDCAYQGFGEDALPAFYGVATSVVTDLRPGELDQLWAGLEEWSCLQDLAPAGRRWVDFFRAVGNRDAVAIDALVPELLETPSHLTPARSRYLVATGMVAHLALRRPQAAMQLWDSYGGDLFEDGVPSFLFKHLVQLARREMDD